jgi:hypothetical protein
MRRLPPMNIPAPVKTGATLIQLPTNRIVPNCTD